MLYIVYSEHIQCICDVYTLHILALSNVYHIIYNVYTMYIHSIYHVYTWYVYTCACMLHATEIACTSCCFQNFMALIAYPRRCLIEDTAQEAHNDSCWKTGGGNYSISCELGVRYPTLQGSAGHDEQERFAYAQVGEVPLQWICS